MTARNNKWSYYWIFRSNSSS